MAIDARISMMGQAPNVGQAINIFENALMNSQTRDIRQQQADQQALLSPLQVQLTQQSVDAGNAQANDIANQRKLKSFNDFAIGNQSIISNAVNTGDPTQLQGALVKRREQMIQQGLPTDETDEAITMLGQGNIQGVVSALSDSVKLYNQSSGRQEASTQFGGQKTFKDSTGNLFFGTTKRNPNTGEVQSVLSAVDGSGSQPSGQVSLVTSAGETASERDQSKVDVAGDIQDIKTSGEGKSAAIKAGVKQAEKAFEKMPVVRTAIGNYDDAMTALDNGAETGTITRLFPSIKTAGKALDNTIKRLGLDVVGNTTFGALSESELAFALQAAIPDNMNPADLKKWLSAKKNAQQKILAGLDEVSTFLGDGTKTITDWKNKQAIDKLADQQEADRLAPPSPAPQAAQRTGGVIMTDAQGNRATVYPDGTFEEL
jgi:hypothetical protein